MASAPTTNIYNNLQFTNSIEGVWVSPVESYGTHLEGLKNELTYNDYVILIGPTGAGKSSFIEAIASKSMKEPLGIAGDQLDSVTQEPCIYEIKNLKDHGGDTIYIIDTPGFADPRISELHVLDKMTYWRDQCRRRNGYVRLLYFHPITDTRMPASRKQCIDMIKRFWGLRLSEKAMLVTSLWDRVPERSKNVMEDRFAQLSANHWGDWSECESFTFKFENTFDSAMRILNTMCMGKSEHDDFPVVSGLGMEGTTGNPAYESLLRRLSSLEQKRESLWEDLARCESQSQPELTSILTKDLAQTELLLQKFTAEMEDFLKRFGPPQEAPSSSPAPLTVVEAPLTATNPVGLEARANPADFVDSVTVDPTAIHAVDSAAPPEHIVDLVATRDVGPSNTHLSGPIMKQQMMSLPKRLRRWIHKKSEHLDCFGRQGHYT